MSNSERLHWIGIHLIRASVDLEYGIGFGRNKHYLDAKKEIDNAITLVIEMQEDVK